MTRPSDRATGATARFPLSGTQELWCASEEVGSFGPRFVASKALRIAGALDVVALQGALDDVVARHEILRTIVVRDGDPPYQEVHPPGPVPMEIRDLPAEPGGRRDVAEELLVEAELSSLDVHELPLLRAVLGRFDGRDWVLALVAHHSACDAWSIQVVLRDVAACYAARGSGSLPRLPAPRQYGEYAAWQQANLVGAVSAGAYRYWHEQLRGARIFALPTDRPVAKVHTIPYIAYDFPVDAGVVSAAGRLARAMRGSTFMVMVAAFNVLAHQISGTLDPVINTMANGRAQIEYQDTVGPFLNFLALRTGIGDCTSFRDVVARTRAVCLDAYANEVPIQHIERDIPELMAPLRDPMLCDFVFGYFQAPFGAEALRIADGSSEVGRRENASSQIPGGAAWTMKDLPSGDLSGCVQFNPGEFDERTVADWVSSYRRLLSAAVDDPDRAWRSLHRSTPSAAGA
jgi:hypothetical protein